MNIKKALKEIPEQIIIDLPDVSEKHKLMTLAYRRSLGRHVSYERIGQEFGMLGTSAYSVIKRVYVMAMEKIERQERDRKLAIVKREVEKVANKTVMGKADRLEQFAELLDCINWHASTFDNQARTLRRSIKKAEQYYFDRFNVEQLAKDVGDVEARIISEMEMIEDTIKELKKLAPSLSAFEDPRHVADNRPRRASDD